MAGSLRDQLIQSGLVTVDRARKIEKQARAEKHAQRQGKPGAAAPTDEQGPRGGDPAGQPAARPAASPSTQTGTQAGALARARALNAEKAERDRAAQRVVNAKAAEKALRAELKQLIQKNCQRTKVASDDDVPYNFVHGKKVKRIYITRDQQVMLSNGNLVIVNDDGRYHLLSKEVADRVRARDPKRIIAAHGDKPAEPGSDDEYYARFKVPDDLDW